MLGMLNLHYVTLRLLLGDAEGDTRPQLRLV